MRLNNSYKKISVWALAFLAMSCTNDFLNVSPQGQQPSEDFWVDGNDASKAVNALYANLHSWNNIAFAPIALESMGSDEAEKGSSPSDATFMNQYDQFTITSTEGQLNGFWQGMYQTINLANQVLGNVPGIDMEAGLKDRFLAEAKFLRAYCYFRLVRAFGDVPLRLTLPQSVDEYNLPRAPKEEVYAAIEKDLSEAAAVLPQTYAASDLGRITKGAALALHAKVSMYQKKWGEVKSYTEQVMGLGYSLFPDFESLFRVENENCSESVFEIQCKRIDNNKGASNSQYSQVQGVRGVPEGGWGFNVPTQELADAFEAGDPRRDATIIFRGETTPEGDAIPETGDNPMYNQKSYVPFSQHVSGYTQGSDQNIRVIRYAEVLLMNAEANMELGNAQAALEPLNQVRARARGNESGILPDVTTSDIAELRKAIYHERRVELAMEFDRYFDVVRQGRGPEVFGKKGFTAGKNELWPIPQNEIDLSGGILTQNVGY
ncbi:RagB/SusD family nutrient uptake outer membrane protein [Marinilongibacter aquaticus]|uniref:RagB/SusD family nutrient uptake outer membrane protein n=1 Tax=Marinilongibacter aquaticus TaxID=2975157 RepID=UPI0021BD98F9|nr:RagB/SusD family nutrient uptake outer membrane protein [Marinilongibacter aquaticus]UBM59042.1 RagB/SusD family nutrient uptake outer membrane protein [Marinilongibacter aquaticus]